MQTLRALQGLMNTLIRLDDYFLGKEGIFSAPCPLVKSTMLEVVFKDLFNSCWGFVWDFGGSLRENWRGIGGTVWESMTTF